MSLCDASLEVLVRALNQHHTVVAALVEKIEQQSEHIGMLVQSVARAFGSDDNFDHMGAILERFQERTHRDGGYRRRSSTKPTA